MRIMQWVYEIWRNDSSLFRQLKFPKTERAQKSEILIHFNAIKALIKWK